MEQELFKHPPLRLRNGRYCTKDQLRHENVDSENKRLRFEREKYLRAWLASESKACKLERELSTLKEKIKALL